MLNKFLYYVIIIPFSRLPLWILFGIADIFYVLLITIIPYRKKVALGNIKNCFPELTKREQKQLLRKNYRHISNILAEGIKNLSISQKQLKKRFIIENPEIFEEFDKEGKSVVILSSHYSNWEFLITAQNIIIPQRAIGIGKPLSKKFLNKKINLLRERNGMKVVSAKNYKEEIQKRLNLGENMAILALADQAHKPETAFWTEHFNMMTPFSFGAEYLAHQFNFPVVFLKIKRIKRAYYSAKAEIITKSPQQENYAMITKAYVDLLEKQIREKPEDWLWTHKRWKHIIPDNIDEVKNAHKDYFYTRFSK
jgi:Kdo2-lipid IVA lauroyltransferase/acyltransferase